MVKVVQATCDSIESGWLMVKLVQATCDSIESGWLMVKLDGHSANRAKIQHTESNRATPLDSHAARRERLTRK